MSLLHQRFRVQPRRDKYIRNSIVITLISNKILFSLDFEVKRIIINLLF